MHQSFKLDIAGSTPAVLTSYIPCEVKDKFGLKYASVEHAYQAALARNMKVLHMVKRTKIMHDYHFTAVCRSTKKLSSNALDDEILFALLGRMLTVVFSQDLWITSISIEPNSYELTIKFVGHNLPSLGTQKYYYYDASLILAGTIESVCQTRGLALRVDNMTVGWTDIGGVTLHDEIVIYSSMRQHYSHGQCPDCSTRIPDRAIEGDQCTKCGHIFWIPRPTDDNSEMV